MITRFSIVTLVLFFLSAVLVIRPISIPIHLPILGKRRLWLTLNNAPIIAIAILWAAQCLGPAEIRRGIIGTEGVKPYNILILFASLAYMAITLDITGVLQAAAYWVSNKGGSDTRKLYFYFYLMLLVFSVLVGNDPVILSGTAFLVYYTKATHLDETAWVMAEFAVCNTASMVLFLGNPTNVVICEGFNVNNVAFTAYTFFPFLACAVFGYGALYFQYGREHYLPKEMPPKGHLSVKSTLLDPIGALVGSLLLGSCLIALIVVSFFKIDVWKITLPFAFAKFLFDLGWDHYRFTHGRMPNYYRNQEAEIERAMSMSDSATSGSTLNGTNNSAFFKPMTTEPEPHLSDEEKAAGKSQEVGSSRENQGFRAKLDERLEALSKHFPTIAIALPRLPFALIPFAFSQFILIEALAHEGWIDVFSHWFMRATYGKIYPTVWIVGIFGIILCNIAGTNIGATILLTKVLRTAPLSAASTRAAAIALAVASNIGAVSFTFSASLAGLLWQRILSQKGKPMSQWKFACLNLVPLTTMTVVGLAVVSAEMAVLYPSH